MVRELKSRSGSVTGYKHLAKGINNQDYLFARAMTIHGTDYIFGAVLDGCTNLHKGNRIYSKSEVGSVLLGDFLESEIPIILAANASLQDLPGVLFHRCVGYLGSLARMTVAGSPEMMWDFISRRLLTTVIGFAMNNETTTIFTAGDGMFIVNDEVTSIEQGKTPDYLAYQLWDRRRLPKDYELAEGFDVHTYQTAGVHRLAFSTDGLRLVWLENPEIIEEIWSHIPQAPAGLQWWLNGLSEDGAFADDTTIIAFHTPVQDELVEEEQEK